MELSHFDRYPTVEELLKLPGFSGSRVCGMQDLTALCGEST